MGIFVPQNRAIFKHSIEGLKFAQTAKFPNNRPVHSKNFENSENSAHSENSENSENSEKSENSDAGPIM